VLLSTHPYMPLFSSVSEQHTQGHVDSLDGVRGLAILMVIFSHAFQSNIEGNGTFSRVVGTILGYGIFGVDLFFVLSGFLITGILVNSLGSEGYFKKFYARRVLRIFPLYYAVLFVLFALTPMLHLQWHGMGWLMLGYFQNLRPTQIATFSPGPGLQLNHFWSLAIEEQFYLVWPAVIFFVRDRQRLLWITLSVAAVALGLRLMLVNLGVGHLVIHETTLLRADSLVLGGTLALLYRSTIWHKVQQIAPWMLFATATIVVTSILLLGSDVSTHPPTSWMARLWIDGLRYSVLALGSACLIAWSMRSGSVAKWVFERSWPKFLGKHSYGIYVLHLIALPFLVNTQRAIILHATHSKMLAVVGAGMSVLVLSVAAAYISFKYFEMPFLRLKKLFVYTDGPKPRLTSEKPNEDEVFAS
jgi:peptidoglycan/LPS O-acetylase OafA/YrhL